VLWAPGGLGAEPPTSWRPSVGGRPSASERRAEGTGRKLVTQETVCQLIFPIVVIPALLRTADITLPT
jgi:hypothetical protein